MGIFFSLGFYSFGLWEMAYDAVIISMNSIQMMLHMGPFTLRLQATKNTRLSCYTLVILTLASPYLSILSFVTVLAQIVVTSPRQL